MQTSYDVAIIGGGPAGSTAATLLARAGKKVLVVEREQFPRFHIGESLLPFSTKTFDRLGIRSKLDSQFVIKHGAEIATTCGKHRLKFYFKNGFCMPYPTAYQVRRAEFDKILLDHAADCGAEVMESTKVERVEFEPQGAADGSGGESAGAQIRLYLKDTAAPVHARYVIDASGRQSLIGSQLGLKQTYAHLQKFSVYAHFENVEREEGIDGTLIRVIRGEDRWFWMIPLTTTRMSIGVVLDAAEFKRIKQEKRVSMEQFLEEAIAEQPVIAERTTRAVRTSEVHSAGDYSYRNSRLVGGGWLLAGDAAGFIDPVFSTGVFLAIHSGEQAADTLLTALAEPKRALSVLQNYEKRLQKVMSRYLRFVSAWYSKEFIEVFMHPHAPFQIPQAVNSVLGGNLLPSWGVWWRMEVFYLILKLQKWRGVCPRLDLTPGKPINAFHSVG